MLHGLTIKKQGSGAAFSGRFSAMGSDCEVLVESRETLLAKQMIEAVFIEAQRIERKFSRYLNNNIVYQINNSAGAPITLDKETAHLVDFASLCYQMSDGLFDISSGVLRKIWSFDGSEKIPESAQINHLLPFIGFDKLIWQAPNLTLPVAMELDFGGIGKEYAVDCCLVKTQKINAELPILLNFGGDLNCNGPRRNGQPWKVGIESVGDGKPAVINLKKGALATSGDANRYLLKAGVRYSHILNPLSGYPVIDAPRSVTVAAESCLEAGVLSTMAMLQGAQADAFLREQQVNFWIQE